MPFSCCVAPRTGALIGYMGPAGRDPRAKIPQLAGRIAAPPARANVASVPAAERGGQPALADRAFNRGRYGIVIGRPRSAEVRVRVQEQPAARVVIPVRWPLPNSFPAWLHRGDSARSRRSLDPLSCMPLIHSHEELRAWLRLTLEPGIGPAAARQLLKIYGLPQHIYAQSRASLAEHLPAHLAAQLARPPSDEHTTAFERTLRWCETPDHHLLTLADADYPPLLLEIHDPPPLLYVTGDPSWLARPAVAVVGARHATPDGLANARAFSRRLAREGWCVISGMALGIDTAAHEGALDAAGAGTIAVVGTGADVIYPARNRGLAARIAANGALVSELPLGTPALAHQFPRRNRLVAGLSCGTLVAEAAARSGSLITARLAAEMGREVFAIPGSIHSPMSRGCHALIRQGAKLVEAPEDILDELGGTAGATRPPPASPPRPHDAVLAAMGYGPLPLDALAQRSGLPIPELQTRLLELELRGQVARLGGGRYQAVYRGHNA